MKTTNGSPILIQDNQSKLLESIQFLSESEIQSLISKNPECLPTDILGETYNSLISVTTELRSPSGSMDILMTTPKGGLVIIETKLWRNPEARRKVVAQILDYAKDLSKWTYSDLQRELNRNLGTKGNILYNVAKSACKDECLTESRFVDEVSKNLRLGRFLLLIVGDGIREGAHGLTEFINKSGNLNYELAMIELGIYRTDKGDTLVVPRPTLKTVEIQKINIEIAEGLLIQSQDSVYADGDDEPAEKMERREFFMDFWQEYLDNIEFDDPEQLHPNLGKAQNIYIYPGQDKNSWISCYFSQSRSRIGVYFRFADNVVAIQQKEELEKFKELIQEELGSEVKWNWDNRQIDGFSVSAHFDDVYSFENRAEMLSFFLNWSNKFVNVLRPKLKEYTVKR